MRRFFVQNVAFLILVNLIVKPLWIFGIDRNVQNAVGHETFGQYQALLNLTVIFQIFLDFGLQNYNNRTVAQAPEMMRTLFPNILAAKLVLSVFYIILVVLLGVLLGYRGYACVLLFLLCLTQVFSSLLLYLRSNVSAHHHFKTDSFLSVTDRLFMILICSVLLFHSHFQQNFNIEWFIYAQMAAYLFTCIIAFVVCLRLVPINWGHYDLKRVLIICKKSAPYALLVFLMALYIRGDVALMERVHDNGKYEAGVYAAAYRFLDVANNVTGVLFAGLLLPLFGGMLAKREAVQPLVRLSINLLLPVALATVIISLFLGAQIMTENYTEATAYDGKVFTVLMFAFPGYCIGYVYATLLTANGNLRPLIIISMGAILINFTLNTIFIPVYGALGAAVCCAITQLYLSVANLMVARRTFNFVAGWRWLLQYFVFVILIFLICFLVLKTGMAFWYKMMVLSAASGICMILCGFVPFRKLSALLKK